MATSLQGYDYIRLGGRPELSSLPDFRTVFETSPRPLLLIAADAPKFTLLAVNQAHARAFRTTPEALTGWGMFEVFPENPEPAALDFINEVRRSLEEVVATGAAHQMGVRAFPVEAEDGSQSERYWSATNAPICDGSGKVTHIVSAVEDVTGEVQERRSEEARRLLMGEVDHRSRNTLAIVQGFLRLTKAASIEEFREIVSARVDMLARAQTALADRKWEGSGLKQILEAELQPLTLSETYSLQGPKVWLNAHQVQPFSMLIHELATNARKHGALRDTAGRLTVKWLRSEDGSTSIQWTELGTAPISTPARSNFGTRLISETVKQLNGEISLDWAESGLQSKIVIPPG